MLELGRRKAWSRPTTHERRLRRTEHSLELTINTPSRWRRTEQGLELAKTIEVA